MEEKRNAPPKRSLFGTAVCSMVGSAIRSSNRRSDAFQKGMSDAIYNSFSSHDSREEAYRQQRREADQRAKDRWDAIDRRSDAFQKGMSDAIYNSFSSHDSREEAYRQQRREADQRAKDRWDAIDRQKKAEWDARDAALRGKDKAAYNYKNQADYWRNQSKRY